MSGSLVSARSSRPPARSFASASLVAVLAAVLAAAACSSSDPNGPALVDACTAFYAHYNGGGACASCANGAASACNRPGIDAACSSTSSCTSQHCSGAQCDCNGLAKCMEDAGSNCSKALLDYYACSNAECAAACATPDSGTCVCPDDSACPRGDRALCASGRDAGPEAAACSTPGIACTSGAECCSGTCNAMTKVCDKCIANGNDCTAAADCCTGFCADRSPDPHPFFCACRNEGSPCTDSSTCCSGECFLGICNVSTTCLDVGQENCNRFAAACCAPAVCEATQQVPFPVCCLPPGSDCSGPNVLSCCNQAVCVNGKC